MCVMRYRYVNNLTSLILNFLIGKMEIDHLRMLGSTSCLPLAVLL